MGFAREFPTGLALWNARLRMRFSSHLFAPGSCKRVSSSPAQLSRALGNGSRQAPADGLAHPRNGEQIDRFLDRPPIFFGNKNCMPSLAHNLNRLMTFSYIINELVKGCSCLGCSEGGHSGNVRDNVRIVNRAERGESMAANQPESAGLSCPLSGALLVMVRHHCPSRCSVGAFN